MSSGPLPRWPDSGTSGIGASWSDPQGSPPARGAVADTAFLVGRGADFGVGRVACRSNRKGRSRSRINESPVWAAGRWGAGRPARGVCAPHPLQSARQLRSNLLPLRGKFSEEPSRQIGKGGPPAKLAGEAHRTEGLKPNQRKERVLPEAHSTQADRDSPTHRPDEVDPIGRKGRGIEGNFEGPSVSARPDHPFLDVSRAVGQTSPNSSPKISAAAM